MLPEQLNQMALWTFFPPKNPELKAMSSSNMSKNGLVGVTEHRHS